MTDSLTLCLSDNRYSIYRLPVNRAIPDSIWRAEFVTVTRTGKELSIVLSDDIKINAESVSAGWSCFHVKGNLPHDMVGVLAGLTSTLASANCSIFALSTYDTDYVLFKQENCGRVAEALRLAGYALEDW